MIKAAVTRLIGLVATALLATVGLVAVAPSSSPAQAADASRFDPGLIISDSVFYDFGTMSVAEIQRFLNSKVPNCIAKPTAPPCLKDYVMNTPAVTGEDGKCESMPAKTGQSSAQVIYDVARACKINPKVLLVTLQKEQGLISSPNPTEYKYRAALGMSCPDSNAAQCGKVDAGFFMQLYKGAGQLQWYNDPRGSFTYHKVGRVSNIQYDVSASCGKKAVLIKSWATAALYYYTPYTPNAAALTNLYSSGDGCSAYGNRNFWRYYTDWFGSTIGGGFLLKGSGSAIYLIVDNNRYRIVDEDLIEALAPLGPLGEVSDDYLNTFTLGQDLTRVVKSVDGKLYLYDTGKLFSFTGCDQVASYGFDCAKAVQLTSSQISAFAVGGAISPYIAPDTSASYLIENGKKREILDAASATEAGKVLGKPAAIRATAFKHLPWGTPIISNNTLFQNRTTKATMIHSDGQAFEIDPTTASDIDLAKWFRASTGTISSDGLKAILAPSKMQTVIQDSAGQHYVLTTFGKRPITDGTNFTTAAAVMPTSFLNIIASVTKPIIAPTFIKATNSKGTYLVRNAVARATVSIAQRAAIAKALPEATVHTIPASAFTQLAKGQPMLTPLATVKIASSKQLYAVDGLDRMVKLASTDQAKSLGFTAVQEVPVEQLRTYNRATTLAGFKVSCGDQVLIGSNSKFYAIEADAAAHYPGAITALNDLTCALVVKSATKLGRFIKAADGSYWLIDRDKRRAIASATAYKALKADALPAVQLDAYTFAAIAVGKPATATMPTAPPISIPTPTPSGNPTPTPTPSTTPSPSPTATSPVGTLAAGSLVTYRASLYLVNGSSKLAQFDAEKRAELFGLKNPLVIEPAVFEAYESATVIDSAKVKCGAQIYLALLGTYYPMSTADASHYPGKSLTLSSDNCAKIKKTAIPAGRFVLSQTDNRIYLIEKGKRRPILTEETYLALKGDQPAYLKIGPYLTSTLPLGSAAVLPTPTPSGSATPSVSPTPSPTPTT